MRRPVVILGALCATAVLALVLLLVFKHTEESFTLGVGASAPVVPLEPGQEGCQGAIRVPPAASFDRVLFTLGTYNRPGPKVVVEVREAGTPRVLGRGTLAAGYPDKQRQPEHAVDVGTVPAGRSIAVCLRNEGTTRVAVFGNPDVAALPSTADIDGVPASVDIALRFERSSSRSLASLTGAMAERASLFKVSWFGAWTFWVLGALVLLAVPALLVRAVRDLEE